MAIEEFKIRQIEGKSEFFKDILDKIPNWILRKGNMLIFIIFAVICFGLTFIKYPEVITGEALITSKNPPIETYSRSNGRINRFFKHDQDSVQQDDWVIELNNSAKSDEVKKLITFNKQLNSINFIDSIEQVNIPFLSNLGEIQSNYSKFFRAVEEYKLFLSLNPQVKQLKFNKSRENNLVLLKKKLAQKKKLIEEEVRLVSKDLKRFKKLNDNDYSSNTEYEKKQIELLNVKNKLQSAEENILNKDLEINSLLKENSNLENTKSDTYFNLRTNILDSYNLMIYDIKEWENKYIIKAPVSGVLNLFEIRSKHEFIANEQKIFTINTNINQNYFVMVKLPVNNSGKLKIGQLCIVKLNNYNYQDYGMLKGKITSFTSIPKEGFYTIKVLLPQQLTTTTGYELKNKSNLTGSAEIIIGDYTIFSRVFNFITSENY